MYNELINKLQGLKNKVDALEQERDNAVAQAVASEQAKVKAEADKAESDKARAEAEQNRDEARARVQVVEQEKVMMAQEFEAQIKAIYD
jgi:hypothetical protein